MLVVLHPGLSAREPKLFGKLLPSEPDTHLSFLRADGAHQLLSAQPFNQLLLSNFLVSLNGKDLALPLLTKQSCGEV